MIRGPRHRITNGDAVCSCDVAGAQGNGFEPVTRGQLGQPPPGDWLMINRTYDEQRFSPLDQINKSNVGQLQMAWSRGLPTGTQ
mgnify:CR=1 FL=1